MQVCKQWVVSNHIHFLRDSSWGQDHGGMLTDCGGVLTDCGGVLTDHGGMLTGSGGRLHLLLQQLQLGTDHGVI